MFFYRLLLSIWSSTYYKKTDFLIENNFRCDTFVYLMDVCDTLTNCPLKRHLVTLKWMSRIILTDTYLLDHYSILGRISLDINLASISLQRTFEVKTLKIHPGYIFDGKNQKLFKHNNLYLPSRQLFGFPFPCLWRIPWLNLAMKR